MQSPVFAGRRDELRTLARTIAPGELAKFLGPE